MGLTDQIKEVVRECGVILLEGSDKQKVITEKEGSANFVTDYDKRIEEILKTKLLKILPEAQFMGEESEERPNSDQGYVFIVDPIDGTTNFIRGFQCSAVSVGLAKDGEIVLGIVYNPYLDEMFEAEKGKGAYCNGKAIHVSDRPLSQGIILVGSSPYYKELAEQTFQMAYDYFRRAADIRRCASAALDLCSIAAGRAELYFELKIQPWDYAAGMLIVQEAGGVVTTVEREKMPLDCSSSVFATNQAVRKEV